MSKIRVERFTNDADIKDHMLPASHGRYGLDTHTYDFSDIAKQQFQEWHFRKDREWKQAARDEHEARIAEFNRVIAERKLALLEARPTIEVVSDPKMRRRDFGVRVKCRVGNGPGPIEYYYVAFRPVELRGRPEHTWTKWRTDFRAYSMPKTVLVYTLNPGKQYDIVVYGGSKHGGVYSESVTVAFGAALAEHAPVPVQEAAEEKVEPPVVAPEPSHQHMFGGVWGNAWNQFPGIAPGRRYGSIGNASFKLPNGEPGLVTALFHTNYRTLRLTLDHGTPSDQFPDEIRIGSDLVFDDPGGLQKFGLGYARDYELESGSPDRIRVGDSSTFTLVWD